MYRSKVRNHNHISSYSHFIFAFFLFYVLFSITSPPHLTYKCFQCAYVILPGGQQTTPAARPRHSDTQGSLERGERADGVLRGTRKTILKYLKCACAFVLREKYMCCYISGDKKVIKSALKSAFCVHKVFMVLWLFDVYMCKKRLRNVKMEKLR